MRHLSTLCRLDRYHYVDFQTNNDQYQIVTVGDVRYLALCCKDTEPIMHRPGSSLATVVAVEKGAQISKPWVQNVLETYASHDDVFRPEFLTGVVFVGASQSEVDITEGARDFLEAVGNKWIEWIRKSSEQVQIPLGPCAFVNGQFTSILRLFDDSSKAFIVALKPSIQGKFSDLGITGQDYQTLSVAIPSRLAFDASSAKPLSGWRIAVKDNFLLEGLRTSLCNKAYYEMYPPADKTATCIKRLIEAGAVILGKTKLSSMVSTEEPTQGIDYQTAWNPRADGYQSPAGSSSGSGAAIGSYDWLDISIGSDTSGSGRRPAHWNGCFGLRPTHGLLPNEGFVRSFDLFDTPSFFGRDLSKCRVFVEAWYGSELLNFVPEFPTSIIYPSDYLPVANNDQQIVIDKFIQDLEASLGLKHTKVSFKAIWDEAPPEAAKGQGLEEFMKDVPRDAYWYDDYHATDQFREDYRTRYHKDPYVSPAVRYQWSQARHISKSTRDEAVRRIGHYKEWFLLKVMKAETTNTLVILPIENIAPRYRDEPPLGKDPLVPPTPTTGTGVLFESPASGSPELVIPVGEVPFESKVTGNTEYLPMGVSLMALPGSDLMLIDIARMCLEKAGRPTTLCTGKSMFQSDASG